MRVTLIFIIFQGKGFLMAYALYQFSAVLLTDILFMYILYINLPLFTNGVTENNCHMQTKLKYKNMCPNAVYIKSNGTL